VKLTKVKEVVDTIDNEQANKYLNLGWTIINTFVTIDGESDEANQTLHYVLAWAQDEEEPKYPTSKYEMESE